MAKSCCGTWPLHLYALSSPLISCCLAIWGPERCTWAQERYWGLVLQSSRSYLLHACQGHYLMKMAGRIVLHGCKHLRQRSAAACTLLRRVLHAEHACGQ